MKTRILGVSLKRNGTLGYFRDVGRMSSQQRRRWGFGRNVRVQIKGRRMGRRGKTMLWSRFAWKLIILMVVGGEGVEMEMMMGLEQGLTLPPRWLAQ